MTKVLFTLNAQDMILVLFIFGGFGYFCIINIGGACDIYWCAGFFFNFYLGPLESPRWRVLKDKFSGMANVHVSVDALI